MPISICSHIYFGIFNVPIQEHIYLQSKHTQRAQLPKKKQFPLPIFTAPNFFHWLFWQVFGFVGAKWPRFQLNFQHFFSPPPQNAHFKRASLPIPKIFFKGVVFAIWIIFNLGNQMLGCIDLLSNFFFFFVDCCATWIFFTSFFNFCGFFACRRSTPMYDASPRGGKFWKRAISLPFVKVWMVK